MIVVLAVVFSLFPTGPLRAEGPRVVVSTEASTKGMMTISVQVRTGSARDPEGLEGLAFMTGRMIVKGGFGADPLVFDRRLREIVRPWGKRAYPILSAGDSFTRFEMSFPAKSFDAYITSVLEPMLLAPAFDADELESLRKELALGSETLRTGGSTLLGAEVLKALLYSGSGLAHPVAGRLDGVRRIMTDHLRGFYAAYYVPENITIEISGGERASVERLVSLVRRMGRTGWPWVPGRPIEPRESDGISDVFVVSAPDRGAVEIHAGISLSVEAKDADYWPLAAANAVLRARLGAAKEAGELPRLRRPFSIRLTGIVPREISSKVESVLKEFERFSAGDLSEAECSSARAAASSCLGRPKDGGGVMGGAIKAQLLLFDGDWKRFCTESLRAVSCSTINEVAARRLKGKKPDFVIISGNWSSLEIEKALLSSGIPFGEVRVLSGEDFVKGAAAVP